jgi:hypothetical protein
MSTMNINNNALIMFWDKAIIAAHSILKIISINDFLK